MSAVERMLTGSAGCKDLLACVYGLNELETEAYFRLLAAPGARMTELADALDRDRTTAHRAVQKLVTLSLAEWERVPMDGGGYHYRYDAAEPELVRERIQARVQRLLRTLEEQVERFEETARAHRHEASARFLDREPGKAPG